MDVELSPEMQSFVEEQVASGRFTSAAEVMVSALHALAVAEDERQAFEDELQHRLDSLNQGNGVKPEVARERIELAITRATRLRA